MTAVAAALVTAGGAAAAHDSLRRENSLRLLALRTGSWGGPTTAHTGEVVTIDVSSSYPRDPALPKRFADFLADLLHGPELATLTVQIAPPDEAAKACGGGEAHGCYWPDRRLIVAPGADLLDGTTPETVLAHEYGHHVAASRSNAPWPSLFYGTKRWASYEEICSRSRDHTAYPGDLGDHYDLNPGEAFAETYRLLNVRRLGPAGRETAAPWIADQSFYPDTLALQAVRDDVLSPWRRPPATSWRSELGSEAAFRPPAARGNGQQPPAFRAAHVIRTPLDGTLSVSLTAPPGTTMSLADTFGRKLRTDASGTLRYTVCGERSLVLTVSGRNAGTFQAEVSTP